MEKIQEMEEMDIIVTEEIENDELDAVYAFCGICLCSGKETR